MTKIPVGFRCSSAKFSLLNELRKKQADVQNRINSTLLAMGMVEPETREHKDLMNTLEQLGVSYDHLTKQLKQVEDNKPTDFITDLPPTPVLKGKKKKRKAKQKSVQERLKEAGRFRKLSQYNFIQAEARKYRESLDRILKQTGLRKVEAIAERNYINELRRTDQAINQLSGLDLGGRELDRSKIDVFISHASEDKDSIVRDLADSLIAKGVRVWYDEYSLSIGDSLSQSIMKGLKECTFGIVILSPNFVKKRWTEIELQSLYAKEVHKGKTILPIWHHITLNEVMDFNLHLADKLAYNTATMTIEDMTIGVIKELDKKLTEQF